MLPIDAIKVGDFVAVTAYKVQKPHRVYSLDGHDGTDQEWEWTTHLCNGEPAEVLAIALPFLAVEFRSGDRCTIDVRHYQLAASSEKFKKSLAGDAKRKRSRASTRDAKRSARDACRCGRCGGAMRERLLSAGTGLWGLVCPACDAPKPDGPRVRVSK